MKLLIFGINYEPELTGIGKYTGEMARYYAGQGHEVEVITAPPYYPNWKIDPDYKNWWSKEKRRGVTVLRCPLYVPERPSGLKRILQEAVFITASLRYWVPRYFRKYDAIIVISPPFHLGAIALPHKWIWGTKIINHVQDLQIDAARELEMIKSKALLKVMTWLERQLLKRFSYVSTISEGMKRRILDKLNGLTRVVMFPNWVDADLIYPVPKHLTKRKKWGFTDADKLVIYSGNLGEKQGVSIIPELAARFQDQPSVRFIIIGNGGTKEQLIRQVEQMQLDNVHFLPLQPLVELANVLSTADVHLVLQKKVAADLVMPSKLTNILAVGGHALITAEAGTTLHDVVSEHHLGTLVKAEDIDSLVIGLESILTGERFQDAGGAERYATAYLDKATILDRYLVDIQ